MDIGEQRIQQQHHRVSIQQQSVPLKQASQSLGIASQLQFDPWRRVYVPWVADCLGTLLFVLFSDLLGTIVDSRHRHTLLDTALFESALLFGLTIVFGPLGRGHFNPATTLGSMLCLGTPLLLGISLLLAQFFGALLGALLFRATVSNTAFLDAFSRLGVFRVLPASVEQQQSIEDEQLLLPSLVTNGLDQDEMGRRSPFASRFQVFLVELMASSLLVLAHLLPSLLLLHSALSLAASTASARLIATALGSRSPLGQSANLARAVANFLLATVFARAEEFAVWRLFHVHLFAAICSAIVGAAIFWLFKYALNATERAELLGEGASSPVEHPLQQQQQRD